MKNMIRTFFALFLLTILTHSALAQSGKSVKNAPDKKDTITHALTNKDVIEAKALVPIDTTPFVTPKKTALFSAIAPGLGQYHNKQYWKIPVIYVGVGAAVYFLQDNIKNYNAARTELAARANGHLRVNKNYLVYDDTQLTNLQNYYKSNLDLTVLLTGLGYTLQILDAVVFAHLKGFDISEDITMKMQPVLTPQGGLGFGLVMHF